MARTHRGQSRRLVLTNSTDSVEAPGSAQQGDRRTDRQPHDGRMVARGPGTRRLPHLATATGTGEQRQAGRQEGGAWLRGPLKGGKVSSDRRERQEEAKGRGWPGARGQARPRGRHSPLQGGQLEALSAELDEGSQVRLAHAAYGVDVGAGAVVLGQVAEEAGDKGNTGVLCGGPERCGPRRRAAPRRRAGCGWGRRGAEAAAASD